MKIIVKILVFLISLFSFAEVALADVAPPSKETTFYFQKDGQPITQPVKFFIKCYGNKINWNMTGSDNKILKISEMSETCQTYGCKFDTVNVFSTYRQSTKYCNLEGEVNGEKFIINNFLGDNLNRLSCHHADFDTAMSDISKGGITYYKITEKYNNCLKEFNKEAYPQGNGEVTGDFICDKYRKDEDLIPTNLSTEPNGPCYYYKYTIKNNVCYQIPDEFFNCASESNKKRENCNQYLEDVTSKLSKDKNGYPFEEICEIKVDVNTAIPNVVIQQSKNILIRIFYFLKCTFQKLSGKYC